MRMEREFNVASTRTASLFMSMGQYKTFVGVRTCYFLERLQANDPINQMPQPQGFSEESKDDLGEPWRGRRQEDRHAIKTQISF